MSSPTRRAGIVSTGDYYPKEVRTNHDLAKFVDTSHEWIVDRCGVHERRVAAKGEATSALGAHAARMALEARGVDPGDVGCVVCCTITSDMKTPSSACLIIDKLGANERAWGFDLSAGCSGYVYGLRTAQSLVESGLEDRVVVVGADVMSSVLDYNDRTTCVLFGDGAGATLVEPVDPDFGIIDSITISQGEADLLCIPAGGSRLPITEDVLREKRQFVYQSGREVFKHAVHRMAEVSLQILEKNNLKLEDLDFFIPHQANIRIIEATAKKLKLPMEKVGLNLSHYANTTDATIPTCLHQSVQAGRIKKGDLVMFTAFGAGFTWGSVLVRWAY